MVRARREVSDSNNFNVAPLGRSHTVLTANLTAASGETGGSPTTSFAERYPPTLRQREPYNRSRT